MENIDFLSSPKSIKAAFDQCELEFKKGDSSFGATRIFHAFDIPHKLEPDQENPEYFKRFGHTALPQCGGCTSGGGKAPRNFFILKNR